MPSDQCALARAESDDQEETVVCDLDMAALRAFRAEHAPDFNVPLCEKYLPRVYADYRASGMGDASCPPDDPLIENQC